MSRPYTIEFFSEQVRLDIMDLPMGLRVRYALLTERMLTDGANLHEPHTKAMGNGLFELRLKSAEGIARVMYCTVVDRRIVMLHCFVKKTQKTPLKELKLAMKRMKELI